MLQKFESPSNGALDLPELQFDRSGTTENRNHQLQLAAFVVDFLNRTLEILKRTVFDANHFTNFKFDLRPGGQSLAGLDRAQQILDFRI